MPHTGPADTEGATLERDSSFPEVPDNLWSKVQGAPAFESKFNEENLFDSMYYESARQYYADATDVGAQGRQILKLFTRWRDVAAQFSRHVLSGDADNPLDANLSWDAEGAGEALVRPIRTDTFANAQYSQTPTSTGQFNIIPDDTQGNNSTETATQNEQAWLIFGYMEARADDTVPYDYAQSDINDNVGVRRPFNLKLAMEGEQTLKVAERHRGPIMVEPGFDLDIDVQVVEPNITTGLWPLGIEIIRADAAEFGGVLD
jgi:hypothetical protein